MKCAEPCSRDRPTGVNYPGCEGHVEQLLDFLRRCLRIRWEERDLRHVLELLTLVVGHRDERAGKPSKRSASARAARLRADFATKACAKFPENAFFQFVAGETQFDNGSRDGDRQSARTHFERALELAKGTSDPDDAAWVKRGSGEARFHRENGPVFLAGVCVRRRRG